MQNFGKWRNGNKNGNYNYRTEDNRKVNVKIRKFARTRIKYSEKGEEMGVRKWIYDVEILIMARA